MPYKTIGSRSRADRLYVLFLGISFLAALNIQMFGGIDAPLFLITVFAGWLLYKKVTLYKHTYYFFDKDAIEVSVSSKKTYKIPLSDIESMSYIQIGRLPKALWGNIVDYSTSKSNLIEIRTKDNVVIHISPKTIQSRVEKSYPFKGDKKERLA